MSRSLTIPLMALAAAALAGVPAGRWLRGSGTGSPAASAVAGSMAAGAMLPAASEYDLHGPVGDWVMRAESAQMADYPRLLAEAEELFPRSMSSDAMCRWLLGRWILQDYESALAWAEQELAKNEDSGLYLKDFGKVLGTVNPELGVRLLRDADGVSEDVRYSLLRGLSRTAPKEYLQFLDSFGAGDSLAELDIGEAFSTLAARVPEEAAELWESIASRTSQDIAASGRSLDVLLRKWVDQNPAEALKWINDLADPALRMHGRHAWLAALAR